MLLSAFKTQQHIVDAVPDCVKKAIGAGVGMFIAFCGFQSAGLIQKSDSTLVTVGDLSNPGTVLALAGIAITAVLVIRQVKGGILIGILLVTVLGLFVKDPVTGAAYTTLPTSVFSFDNPGPVELQGDVFRTAPLRSWNHFCDCQLFICRSI